jgi:hypothetical protein
MAGMVNVRAGTFDDTRWIAPRVRAGTSRKQPWLALRDSLMAFERQP